MHQLGFSKHFPTNYCFTHLTDIILIGMDKGMHTKTILDALQ